MITVIDYGMGNVGSIRNMLSRIGFDAVVTCDLDQIRAASKLILPGVGAFDRAMENLHKLGLVDLLGRRVLEEGVPILGICLGMQLFSRRSDEGEAAGLGWIPAETLAFRKNGGSFGLKLPHMGWNTLSPSRAHPILADLPVDHRFYFVHSYYVACDDPDNVLATTRYGIEFHSAVSRGNITGVQFHPEKSHRFGMKILENFSRN